MNDSTIADDGFVSTAVAAMTLREDVFRARSFDPRAFQRGLVFVLLVGLVAGLAGVVGAALTTWTSPSMTVLRDAITEGIMGMPWQEQVPPEVLAEVQRQMQQNLDIVFGILEWVTPNLPSALAGVILQPLGMVIFWLLFGLLAHFAARMLSGTGSLAQTYGGTALSAAPQVLGVVQVLPYVQTAGLATWSLICAYLAIKQVHGLSPARAFWATLAPFLLFALLALLLGISAAALALSLANIGGQR